MRKHSQNRRSERGAAAVEFALVVPVLLLLVIGIMNFGVLLAQQISLNHGARQAARYAVVDDRNCGQIKTIATSGSATVGMVAAQVTPVVTNCGADTVKPCTGTAAGSDITVTLTKTTNSWLLTAPPFNAIPVPAISGKGVMRCEFS